MCLGGVLVSVGERLLYVIMYAIRIITGGRQREAQRPPFCRPLGECIAQLWAALSNVAQHMRNASAIVLQLKQIAVHQLYLLPVQPVESCFVFPATAARAFLQLVLILPITCLSPILRNNAALISSGRYSTTASRSTRF